MQIQSGAAGPGRPAYLAQLLIMAGDIEQNPGPGCPLCFKPFGRKACVWCTRLGGLVHLGCTTLKSTNEWRDDFECKRCVWCRPPHKQKPASKVKKESSSHLVLLQTNVNGLRARATELMKRIADEKPHIVAVQETHLTEKQKPPRIQGYNVASRADRRAGKGGGSLIFVKEGIPYSRPQDPYAHSEDSNVDVSAVEIYLRGREKIRVVNVYNPPTRWSEGQGTQTNTFQPKSINRGTHCYRRRLQRTRILGPSPA